MSGRRGVRRIHSETMMGAASAAMRSIQGKPNQIAARTSGPRIAADTVRSNRPRKRAVGANGALTADAAIATFAAAELGDGLLEMVLAEVGPQCVDENKLRVGALPQQEIADALLAARADQQIRVGHTSRQKLALKTRLINALGRKLAGGDTSREAAGGAQDLVA